MGSAGPLNAGPARSEIILGNVLLLRFRALLPQNECSVLGNSLLKRIIKQRDYLLSGGNDA